MKVSTHFAFGIVALLMCVLASCGFHLRGTVEIPDQVLPIYIASDDAGLKNALKRLFLSNKVTPASKESDAVSILKITRVEKKRRVISTDSQGRAREYELTYQFDYEFLVNTNSLVTNKISLSRDLAFDPLNVLAVGYETSELYEDMQKDSVRLVLQQVMAIARQHVKQDAQQNTRQDEKI